MKKHNMRSRIKFGMTIALVLVLFAGCKTVPAGMRPVDAIELIDANSSFYMAVPKATDNVLIEHIITNMAEGVSEQDAKAISAHIDKIYCGLNRSRKSMEFQASVEGQIPRSFLPKVLNAKNGWVSNSYTPAGSEANYKIYSGPIEMTFPTDKICCIGRDINGMLDKYDYLSKLPAEDNIPGKLYSDLDEELIGYLKGAETDIRFFANKPQSFLTILTGAQLDLKLIDVKGSFTTDEKHPNQYFLDLDFRFKNGTFLKAGRTLLVLAFGLTNSQEEIIGDSELIIKKIRIDKKQLYKLLSL